MSWLVAGFWLALGIIAAGAAVFVGVVLLAALCLFTYAGVSLGVAKMKQARFKLRDKWVYAAAEVNDTWKLLETRIARGVANARWRREQLLVRSTRTERHAMEALQAMGAEFSVADDCWKTPDGRLWERDGTPIGKHSGGRDWL